MRKMTVQVRDLDPDVLEQLKKSARSAGLSLSAFLRQELTDVARKYEVRGRADALRGRNALGGPFPELAGIDLQTIVELTRESRDDR